MQPGLTSCHDGSEVGKDQDMACEWTHAGATTRYSVALGRWVWNSGEDTTPTICRSSNLRGVITL